MGVSGKLTRTPSGKTAADATATAPTQAGARDFILELTGGKGTIKYDVAINALQSRGEARLLAVTITKDSKSAGPYVDLVNTFYGRADIPIGVVRPRRSRGRPRPRARNRRNWTTSAWPARG